MTAAGQRAVRSPVDATNGMMLRCPAMEDSPLVIALKWFATGATTVAAFTVALDIGRRWTGWGFVVFTIGSVAWVAGAVLASDWALTTTNAVLFGINLFGVYRYLIRRRHG